MAQSNSDKPKEGVGDTIRTVIYAILIAVVFRTFLFQPFWIPSGSMKSTLLIGDYLFISKYAYGYSRHSFPWSLAPFEGRIWGEKPERGDVIVFKHPRTNEDFIKRLIGLPGDEIQVRNGVVFINGEEASQTPDGFFTEDLDRGRAICLETPVIDGERRCVKERQIETLPGGVEHLVLNANSNRGSEMDNTPVFTVPEGQYFFMGDNRDNSSDSRVQGRGGVGFVPYENLVGRAELIAISSDGPFYEIWNWRWGRSLTIIE